MAAPIDAAVGANILSEGSSAQALSDQGVMINQDVSADAVAHATQASDLEQGAAPGDATSGTVGTDGTASADGATGTADATSGDLAGAVDGATGAVGDATGDLGGAVDGATGAAGQLGGTLDGNLLNVDVDLDGDANLAAPVSGAVAAYANVAAPIDAALAANIGSVDSDAVAVAQQDAIINQGIEGSAEATSDQASDITQP